MAAALQRNQVDLVDFVDWRSVECLNQSPAHPFANALKQGNRDDEGLHLESHCDEKLLIYIPFTRVVKLHSVVLVGSEEEGPRTVKLFANKKHMVFSNVNDYPPSDSAVLSLENLKGKPVLLKYVKFQSVRSLSVFIEDNQGGADVTKVQKIFFYGTTLKANVGALTNFEVLDFLRSRNATSDPLACLGSVAPSECKVFDYLERSVACNQTKESINAFLEKCNKFGLVKAEKLNIINLRPTSPVEAYAIIELSDSRLGDPALEELTQLVYETLPASPCPSQNSE